MSTALSATSVCVPSPEVVARRIAGQHLLVPVRTGAAQMDYLYTTDDVGSFIYGLLDGRTDARAVARRVADSFEVEEAAALADVLGFLGTLAAAGLVRMVETAP